ncbi:hypothetical protein V6N11_000397 [Hibiscus sabdariffa]|uniref:Uncharacterized protein n=2 Tax=Hibiscus sabdariffa TaxID=183260 RepID=A0ABR2NTE2_9ROSI
MGKGSKEGVWKGLQVHKSSASKTARSNVVEWVKTVQAQVDLIGESAMVDESVAPQPLPILEANEGDVCDMKTITEMSNKEEQQEDDHTSI